MALVTHCLCYIKYGVFNVRTRVLVLLQTFDRDSYKVSNFSLNSDICWYRIQYSSTNLLSLRGTFHSYLNGVQINELSGLICFLPFSWYLTPNYAKTRKLNKMRLFYGYIWSPLIQDPKLNDTNVVSSCPVTAVRFSFQMCLGLNVESGVWDTRSIHWHSNLHWTLSCIRFLEVVKNLLHILFVLT